MPETRTREERLEARSRAREFNDLLERSSLAEDKLWTNCPTHGRQAVDPFAGICILCAV